MNYQIIVSKNHQKIRLVKRYTVKNNAITHYNNLISENQKVKFEKKFVCYEPCQFHIELHSAKKFTDIIEWYKDELGRNVEVVNLDGMFLWKMAPWKEPENFRIFGKDGRYEYEYLENILRNTKDMISMSTIQNLLILDVEGTPLIVMLKNIPDAIRLHKTIRDENMPHILPFGKMSKHNRKIFFNKTKSLGIPTRLFYTNSTER